MIHSAMTAAIRPEKKKGMKTGAGTATPEETEQKTGTLKNTGRKKLSGRKILKKSPTRNYRQTTIFLPDGILSAKH